MLGRRPRSLLHRTSSKGELHTQSHEIVHLPSSEDEKPVLQPPHQIVIGFDLGADSSPACESPRSVLEPHHLCFRSHHQPLRSPRSPLSALGSLLSGNGPCTEGAALCLKVSVKAEEAAVDANARQTFSRRGHVGSDVDGADPYCTLSKREHNMADHSNANMQCKAVAFPRTNCVGVRKNQPWNYGRSYHVRCGSRANPHSKTFVSSDCEDEDHDEAANDNADSEDIIDNPVSIFSTASPVLNYFRCDTLAVDFLSKCFLCRRHLLQGKDIYMYRGDRAFCSQECRYQQIVVDERKERYPAAVTCVSGASTHNQRLRKATQAAVA